MDRCDAGAHLTGADSGGSAGVLRMVQVSKHAHTAAHRRKREIFFRETARAALLSTQHNSLVTCTAALQHYVFSQHIRMLPCIRLHLKGP